MSHPDAVGQGVIMGKTKTDKFFDKLTLADDFVFKMVDAVG